LIEIEAAFHTSPQVVDESARDPSPAITIVAKNIGLSLLRGRRGSIHMLSEIGLNDVDQFLDTLRFGGTTFDSRIDHVHADMVLNDLRNKAVYRTARRYQDMQDLCATLLLFKCPVGRFYLAADASNSVQKLGLLSDGVWHFPDERSLKVDKVTLRGRHFVELAVGGPYAWGRSLRSIRRSGLHGRPPERWTE
jgi:hypothetical protein